jgi:hypothetical protein
MTLWPENIKNVLTINYVAIKQETTAKHNRCYGTITLIFLNIFALF